jgi:hypothetical protein
MWLVDKARMWDRGASFPNIVASKCSGIELYDYTELCSPNIYLTDAKKGKTISSSLELAQRVKINVAVYPGDELHNTIAYITTGNWSLTWQLTPGTEGIAAGQKAFSGSLIFDPTLYRKPYLCLTQNALILHSSSPRSIPNCESCPFRAGKPY